jgi:iron(III) transport system substrate-binding protein
MYSLVVRSTSEWERRLSSNGDKLSLQERKVARYVLKHKKSFRGMTIKEIAGAVSVSEATVVRFCHRLGYEGLKGFKIAMAADLAAVEPPEQAVSGPGHVLDETIYRYIACLQDTALLDNAEAFERAVSTIMQAPKLDVYGVGGSISSISFLRHMLIKVGIRINECHSVHSQQLSTATLNASDAVIVISNKGESGELIQIIPKIRERGAAIICITSRPFSPIARMSDIVLKAAAGIDAADVVFCQDGGRVYAELMEPGYVLSYTPPSLRDIIPKEFQNPQVWDIPTKQFIFNSEKSEAQPYQNIWELTEPAWKGRVQFKDPFGEGVNMNFLTMVTKPEIASQVAKAYRSRYGKDIVLTTPNAGYEWIKAFFGNGLILGKSDTTMSEAIGAKGQSVQLAGLFTLNKVRAAKAKNLALKTATAMEPFTGFYYPIYCFIPSNSRSPNAAKLFIEYCLTEGYAAWNELGDYSPNPQNPNTEDPIPLSQWVQWLVGEDPKWCAENRAEVEEFLNSIF